MSDETGVSQRFKKIHGAIHVKSALFSISKDAF